VILTFALFTSGLMHAGVLP